MEDLKRLLHEAIQGNGAWKAHRREHELMAEILDERFRGHDRVHKMEQDALELKTKGSAEGRTFLLGLLAIAVSLTALGISLAINL